MPGASGSPGLIKPMARASAWRPLLPWREVRLYAITRAERPSLRAKQLGDRIAQLAKEMVR
jgi:hypothetical protein